LIPSILNFIGLPGPPLQPLRQRHIETPNKNGKNTPK